jgi:hypothetical protein
VRALLITALALSLIQLNVLKQFAEPINTLTPSKLGGTTNDSLKIWHWSQG